MSTDDLERIALTLAPSLKDKFDLSVDKDFDDWADMSFKAAKAFYNKTEGFKADIDKAAKEIILAREAEAARLAREAAR